jgi:hypothetical protein
MDLLPEGAAMTLEQIEQERKRFEASEVARDLDLTRQVDGSGYLYYPTSACWFAWLARAQEEDKPEGWPWDAEIQEELAFLVWTRIESTMVSVEETGLPTPLQSAAASLARWLEQSPEQGGHG